MRNRFIFRTIVIAILIAAVGYSVISNAKKDNKVYKVGDKAPDFELTQISPNVEQQEIKLSDYKGKGVMLNFWATFCEPCEYEMPFMEELYDTYQDQGIEVIAVNLGETELVVKKFIEQYDLSFPIPHDSKGVVRSLYKIGPIPTSYFINSEGEIVRVVESALELEKLEEYFQEIMPET